MILTSSILLIAVVNCVESYALGIPLPAASIGSNNQINMNYLESIRQSSHPQLYSPLNVDRLHQMSSATHSHRSQFPQQQQQHIVQSMMQSTQRYKNQEQQNNHFQHRQVPSGNRIAAQQHFNMPQQQLQTQNQQQVQQSPLQQVVQQEGVPVRTAPDVLGNDFLSSLQIIDTHGRIRELKDFGLGGNGNTPHEPELERQLRSIFDTINRDLENAAFLPLDMNGANQQLGNMFQSASGYSQPADQQQREMRAIGHEAQLALKEQRPLLNQHQVSQIQQYSSQEQQQHQQPQSQHPQQAQQPQPQQQQNQYSGNQENHQTLGYTFTQPKQHQFQYLRPQRAEKINQNGPTDQTIRSPAQSIRERKQLETSNPEVQRNIEPSNQAAVYPVKGSTAEGPKQHDETKGASQTTLKESQDTKDRHQSSMEFRPVSIVQQQEDSYSPQVEQKQISSPVHHEQRLVSIPPPVQQIEQQQQQQGFDDEPTPLKPVEHDSYQENEAHSKRSHKVAAQQPLFQGKNNIEQIKQEEEPKQAQRQLGFDDDRTEQQQVQTAAKDVEQKKYDGWVPITPDKLEQQKVSEVQSSFEQQKEEHTFDTKKPLVEQKNEQTSQQKLRDFEGAPKSEVSSSQYLPSNVQTKQSIFRKSMNKIAASTKSIFANNGNNFNGQQLHQHLPNSFQQEKIIQQKEVADLPRQQEQVKEQLPFEFQQQEEFPAQISVQRPDNYVQQRELVPNNEEVKTEQRQYLTTQRDEQVIFSTTQKPALRVEQPIKGRKVKLAQSIRTPIQRARDQQSKSIRQQQQQQQTSFRIQDQQQQTQETKRPKQKSPVKERPQQVRVELTEQINFEVPPTTVTSAPIVQQEAKAFNQAKIEVSDATQQQQQQDDLVGQPELKEVNQQKQEINQQQQQEDISQQRPQQQQQQEADQEPEIQQQTNQLPPLKVMQQQAVDKVTEQVQIQLKPEVDEQKFNDELQTKQQEQQQEQQQPIAKLDDIQPTTIATSKNVQKNRKIKISKSRTQEITQRPVVEAQVQEEVVNQEQAKEDQSRFDEPVTTVAAPVSTSQFQQETRVVDNQQQEEVAQRENIPLVQQQQQFQEELPTTPQQQQKVQQIDQQTDTNQFESEQPREQLQQIVQKQQAQTQQEEVSTETIEPQKQDSTPQQPQVQQKEQNNEEVQVKQEQFTTVQREEPVIVTTTSRPPIQKTTRGRKTKQNQRSRVSPIKQKQQQQFYQEESAQFKDDKNQKFNIDPNTYNPLQFEPERISPLGQSSSPITNVNSQPPAESY